jgi:hypothetical protein
MDKEEEDKDERSGGGDNVQITRGRYMSSHGDEGGTSRIYLFID